MIMLPLLPPSHSPSSQPKLSLGQLCRGPAAFPAALQDGVLMPQAAGAQAKSLAVPSGPQPTNHLSELFTKLLPGQLGPAQSRVSGASGRPGTWVLTPQAAGALAKPQAMALAGLLISHQAPKKPARQRVSCDTCRPGY
jgi:hypothetical protein